MAFIKKIIGPDETLIGISTAHWVYGATGILWLAGLMMVGLALDYFASGFFEYLFRDRNDFAAYRIGDILFWLPTALGVVMFLLYFLMMISPEIGLTSKRVIYKRGIIFVDVKEVDIEEIKAANVDNGFFGRFLNYGHVIFDARFVQGMDLPAIGNPYRFVKALNDARSKLKEESITGIIDGVGPETRHEEAASNPVQARRINKRYGTKRGKNPERESYPDKADESSHEAIGSVMNEMRNNAAHAMSGTPLSPFRKPLRRRRVRTEATAAPGPVVFDDPLLTKQNELRQEIKDDFSGNAR